jgi:hypothetical protein
MFECPLFKSTGFQKQFANLQMLRGSTSYLAKYFPQNMYGVTRIGVLPQRNGI